MLITNLLTNMVVLSLLGAIPKDTPAFQEYAFHAMFTNAQAAAAKWNLDQRLIATNQITRWTAAAHRSGVSGVIIFGDRYGFRYQSGGLASFSDTLYTPSFLMPGDKTYKSKMKLWLAATNLLSLEQARTIADSALEAVGLEPARTGARPKAIGGQETTPWKGVSEALPYYYFDWQSNRRTVVWVAVSGMTGRIAQLDNNTAIAALAKPTNYLELLGLPTNTVFVRRTYVSGQPAYELLPP